MKITPEIEAYLAEQLEKQKNEIELKIAQSTMNKIKYGCEVVDLIKIDGKPIIDKETRQQKESNGQLSLFIGVSSSSPVPEIFTRYLSG